MKWFISQDDFDDLSDSEKKSGFFVPVKFLKKKLSTKTWTEWAYFDKTSQGDSLNGLKKQGRRKYEIFCGGFLYFHDKEFKKYKKFEHNLRFDWYKKGKNTVVQIWITPTPKNLNPNPPKPPAPPPPES